jgi:hypothetical protein
MIFNAISCVTYFLKFLEGVGKEGGEPGFPIRRDGLMNF